MIFPTISILSFLIYITATPLRQKSTYRQNLKNVNFDGLLDDSLTKSKSFVESNKVNNLKDQNLFQNDQINPLDYLENSIGEPEYNPFDAFKNKNFENLSNQKSKNLFESEKGEKIEGFKNLEINPLDYLKDSDEDFTNFRNSLRNEKSKRLLESNKNQKLSMVDDKILSPLEYLENVNEEPDYDPLDAFNLNVKIRKSCKD